MSVHPPLSFADQESLQTWIILKIGKVCKGKDEISCLSPGIVQANRARRCRNGVAHRDTTPRFNRSMTSALLARAWSWVTTTTHRFSPWALSWRIPAISRAVSASKLPVGSSARMTGAWEAKARAMATRCCCPPERVAIRRRASSGVSPSCSKRGVQTGPRFLPG